MARRRRKGKGRRGSKGVYLSALALPAVVGIQAYNTAGLNKGLIWEIPYQLTGYDFKSGSGWNSSIAVRNLGLVVVAMVSHRVASKLGVNRGIKKATMGLVKGW